MKIIVQGKKPDLSKDFVCSYCGCVFVAEKGEYSTVQTGYNETGYECNCPCCGTSCYRIERDDYYER